MKIALITGGGRGLGRAAAISLAKKGVATILTYHQNSDAVERTIKEVKALGARAYALKLDTEKISTFEEFTTCFKSLLKKEFQQEQFDYLLNNAGVGCHRSFLETTEADFDLLVNIHFKGVYFLTQNLVPLLKDGGRILNVSSGLTRFSYPGASAYASAKGAVEVLSRYLSAELSDRKIGVNCIAPGAIETDFNNGTVRDNKNINQQIANITPLGRVGLPQDIGPIMAELLAGDLEWINGQRIESSGGIHG